MPSGEGFWEEGWLGCESVPKILLAASQTHTFLGRRDSRPDLFLVYLLISLQLLEILEQEDGNLAFWRLRYSAILGSCRSAEQAMSVACALARVSLHSHTCRLPAPRKGRASQGSSRSARQT